MSRDVGASTHSRKPLEFPAMTIYKACKLCTKPQPPSEFYSGQTRCKTCCKAAAKKRREEKYDEVLRSNREYRARTGNHYRYCMKWRKANPHADMEYQARRRLRIKGSSQSLSSQHITELQSFYKEAQRLSKETGIPHHVDHIVPVNGHNICGLHVPWNLQILTAEENLRKSNSIDDQACASFFSL